jgi:hypothetical protein
MSESERLVLVGFLNERIDAIKRDVALLKRTPDNLGLFAHAGQMIAGLTALLAEFEKEK